MHCTISYDLSANAGARRQEIESKINEILAPYHHVSRLTTFYVVHLNNQAEWDALLAAMTTYARSIPERLHFIMSPLMNGGRYDGLLRSGDWQEINAIVAEL